MAKKKEKKPLSRQRLYQLQQIALGLCMYCPEKSVVIGYCQRHYDIKKARIQARQEAKKSIV